MSHKEKYCVLGGDMRQVYLGEMLVEDGADVTFYALEKCADSQPDYSSLETALSKCTSVILPIPLSKDGKTLYAPLSEIELELDDKFAGLLCGKRIFCANKDKLEKSGDYGGTVIYDYLAREELAVLNAVPTAEGAIAAAISNSPKTLHGSRCLVAGFGRIGKILCRDLYALGAIVTAAARKQSDLAWISACGYTAVPTDKIGGSGQFDFVFNTIPHHVFTKDVLLKTSRGAVVIDLASLPGGVDPDECRALHIAAYRALSLPGKTAPEAAARIIKNTIYNIIREEDP